MPMTAAAARAGVGGWRSAAGRRCATNTIWRRCARPPRRIIAHDQLLGQYALLYRPRRCAGRRDSAQQRQLYQAPLGQPLAALDCGVGQEVWPSAQPATPSSARGDDNMSDASKTQNACAICAILDAAQAAELARTRAEIAAL